MKKQTVILIILLVALVLTGAIIRLCVGHPAPAEQAVGHENLVALGLIPLFCYFCHANQ